MQISAISLTTIWESITINAQMKKIGNNIFERKARIKSETIWE